METKIRKHLVKNNLAKGVFFLLSQLAFLFVLTLNGNEALAQTPTVGTIPASAIMGTSVVVGGNIGSMGGSSVVQSGVIFSTTPAPVIGGFGVTDTATNPVVTSGSFTINLMGLTHSTKYYYRAYATNNIGTGYGDIDSFVTSPVIASFPYVQNFDTSGVNTGWVSVTIGTGNDWVVGTPSKTTLSSAYSAPNCWVTKLTGDYASNHNAAVLSPQFDFTGFPANPVLRFKHKFITESYCCDGGWVEISVNGGAWTKVENTLGTGSNYNTPNAMSWYNYAIGAGNAWNGNSTNFSSHVNGWITSQVQLAGAAGQPNVKFRFVFRSDGSVQADGWAIDDIEVYPPSAPSVLTGTKTKITNRSARLSGTITDNNGDLVTANGVVFSTSPSPVRGGFGVVDSAAMPLPNGGVFNVDVTGLTNATTYYYRAYAVNAVGTTYGADSTFTTNAAPVAPTVLTTRASNIAAYAAILSGDILSDGGATVTVSGIVYSSTNNNPVQFGLGVFDTATNPLVASGIFSINIPGLTQNTRYYFRAYAVNSAGTAYGALDSFVTPPVITSLPYAQNFDTAGVNTGWDTASTGGVNDWVLGTPNKPIFNNAFSAPNAWVTKLTGTYSNGANAAVVSPQFDFSTQTADPVLRFRHKFSAIAGIDGAVVEISLNGGNSWAQLDNVVGAGANFNTPISTAWNNNSSPGFWSPVGANFSGTSSGYSSQVAGWIQSTVRLTGAAGQSNVKVRMRFASTTFTFFGTDHGWEFDNVEVFPPVAPTVTTGTKTNLTLSSATLEGIIVSDGNATITASGIVYSTSPSPVRGAFGVVDSANNPVVTSGTFTRNVAGLTPSTIYYYRAYAVNAIGTTYGADSTFTTNATAVAPTVLTAGASSITSDTAVLSGDISLDGGATVTASGIVYSSTNNNPVQFGLGVTDVATNPVVASGPFSVNVSGLTRSTKYYFRAYATNSVGTTYGLPDSFVTSPVIALFPYVQNFDTSGVNTGWASVVIGGTTASDWVVGTPSKATLSSAYSTPNCWVTKLTGDYASNQNAAVLSPQFDFTGFPANPVLRFKHKFVTERNCCDGGWVEISVNGGAWTKVENTLGTGSNYNTANALSWYNYAIGLGNAWNGNSTNFSSHVNGWITSQVQLAGAAGQNNVKVRFVFRSDGSFQADGWAIDDIEVFAPSAPSVLTGTKTNITNRSARLSGNITDNNGTPVTGNGVVYSTSPSPVRGGFGVVDSAATALAAGGVFSVDVTGLTSATTYYYRAYAVNAIGTAYGADSTFITNAAPVAPTVLTAGAGSITAYTATLSGDISLDGGATVTASGIVYSSTNNNPVQLGSGVTDVATNPVVASGPFSVNVSGLTRSAKYYFRAYATNSAGTTYGLPDSFVTSPVIALFPYVQNFDTSGVNTGWDSVVVGGTTASDWVVGTPSKATLSSAYSAPNCWVTKLTGNYASNQNAAVLSPQFDFTGFSSNPVLRFKHKFVTESSCCDGGWLEISINGGAWTKVENTLGTGSNYNTPNAMSWYNYAIGLGNAWNGNSTNFSSHVNGWITSQVQLAGAAGQPNVRFRFVFRSDGSIQDDGWAIDDIEVEEVVAPTIPASGVAVSNVGNTTATVSWTNGNGRGRLVVGRLTTTPAIAPANMINYLANAAYKTGDSTGTGNYIVYKDTGTMVNVTGLSLLTNYTFDVYEYNGLFMHVRFNNSVATGNTTTTPVKLVSFTAENRGGNGLLTWTTANEKNNAGFNIERSLDGKTFKAIGFVKGAGNSNKTLRYAYTDKDVFRITGVSKVYYRLKQDDRDGEFEYSRVLSISSEERQDFEVSAYPVPFQKDVIISITSTEPGSGTLTVSDLQGRTITTEVVGLSNGETILTLSTLNTLQAGIYFVKVTQNNNTRVIRVVKTD